MQDYTALDQNIFYYGLQSKLYSVYDTYIKSFHICYEEVYVRYF